MTPGCCAELSLETNTGPALRFKTRPMLPSAASQEDLGQVLPTSALVPEKAPWMVEESTVKMSKACKRLWFVTLCLLLSWPGPRDRKGQRNRVGSSPAPAALGPSAVPAAPW